ncbi:molybdopterin-dependent oxidoreductase [uncultured Adlercreutzia sp.]|uniref:molybdopterin-containing oxidoreductase family protein n=1 Tax=uncultured Adlercreutzia sp. TaxID=875803 RepID=UPI0026771451|nr:molybdopterin-dependent oxidoreductase [uncultured Adlercreutzia sp.]
MTQPITRRTFVAASAAGAALAASGAALTGCASSPAVDKAYAAEAVNTQCTACPNQCGYAAYTVDGSIDKVVGNAVDPHAAGTLCARGYGMATAAASADRIENPLRRTDSGSFEAIPWDEALAEIGQKLAEIKAGKGGEALAAITDGTSTADRYTTRLLSALGSPNAYVNATTASASVASGLAQATGFTSYEVDYAQAKMVVILGASTVEIPDPGTVAALEAARAAGARIVMVDSRMPAAASLASEWLPVRAGTDLALVLALARCIIERGADAEASGSMSGLDEWKSALEEYTPAWAASVCGIGADVIEGLAGDLAKAAPAACIDLSWMALFGGSYGNTGELARAVALTNTLLGCWNVPGGAYLAAPVAAWDAVSTAPLAVEAVDVTAESYPLAVGGSPAYALRLAHEGAIAGLILVDANVVAEYPDPAYVKEAVETCPVSVAVTPEMTETARCCRYVLPEKVWSESDQLPTVTGAVHPVLNLSSQVIEPVVPEARSVAEIASGLAQAADVADAFNFDVAAAAAEMCEACGCTYEGASAVGTTSLEPLAAEAIVWPTASGTVECASAACEAAGYTATPTWVEPTVTPDALGYGYYRLTTGNQAVQAATKTANAAPLAAIAEQYELDSLWMNAQAAAEAGIVEGDKVIIENEYASAPVRVHVTELIEPAAVYLASHYGVEDDEQTQADGLGVRQARFATFGLEPGYGAPLLQETMVTVGKAGA